MIECTGIRKEGARVRRVSTAVALEPALLELMRIYDRIGGAGLRAAVELDAAIEMCLVERPGGRERIHAHLQLLLRARELHGYALAEPDLTPLKVRLYEHLLQHRTAPERWAAVRELLLEHLDAICQSPLPGLMANLELYKRAMSDRASRLGRLLLTVGLFNQELEGEQPPPNLVLRFRRGAFPLHSWELCAQDGRTAHLGTMEPWSPATPLARWEYLATDLAHALWRRLDQTRGARRWAREEPSAQWAPAAAPEADTVYGRFDAEPGAGTGATRAAQLELLPLDPCALRGGLLRRVHARFGPEGVKLFAILCEHLGQAPSGAPFELTLPPLAAAAGFGDATARGMRQRAQRLARLVELLGQVELIRVSGQGSACRARTSRLLAVLGHSGGWPADESEGSADTALRVLADPYLRGALGEPLSDLPPLLLDCAGKARPCVLPLYVWLREQWHAESAPPAVERTARALLDEAGLWVSEAGRYRGLEALRRDLDFMREQGWLGGWRVQRSEMRDALEDRYRLHAPVAAPTAGALARGAGVRHLTAVSVEARTGT